MPDELYPEGAGYANPSDFFAPGTNWNRTTDWINRRPELLPLDKLVWGLLVRRAGKDKTAKGKRVQYTALAADLGVSVKMIKASISRLKKSQLIRSARNNRNLGNEYHFLQPKSPETPEGTHRDHPEGTHRDPQKGVRESLQGPSDSHRTSAKEQRQEQNKDPKFIPHASGVTGENQTASEGNSPRPTAFTSAKAPSARPGPSRPGSENENPGGRNSRGPKSQGPDPRGWNEHHFLAYFEHETGRPLSESDRSSLRSALSYMLLYGHTVYDDKYQPTRDQLKTMIDKFVVRMDVPVKDGGHLRLKGPNKKAAPWQRFLLDRTKLYDRCGVVSDMELFYYADRVDDDGVYHHEYEYDDAEARASMDATRAKLDATREELKAASMSPEAAEEFGEWLVS